jgi:hypothetical protein
MATLQGEECFVAEDGHNPYHPYGLRPPADFGASVASSQCGQVREI